MADRVRGSESLLHAPAKANRERLRLPKPDFLDQGGGNQAGPFDVDQFPIVVSSLDLSTTEERMSDVAEKTARLRQLRNAALLAIVIPAALLAGCSSPTPPPQTVA